MSIEGHKTDACSENGAKVEIAFGMNTTVQIVVDVVKRLVCHPVSVSRVPRKGAAASLVVFGKNGRS